MASNDNGQEYRTSICKASKKNPEKYPGCGKRIIWKLPYVTGSRPFDDINFEYQHECTGQVTASTESMIKPIEPKEEKRRDVHGVLRDVTLDKAIDEEKKVIEKAYYEGQLTKKEVKELFKILARLI